jgi:sugar phosphate isomerase/epimerase
LLNAFKFFDFFIPSHTVDFMSESEVEARMEYTSRFLDAYPVADAGFEFVVFPKKLDLDAIALQVEQYTLAKSNLESKHRVHIHASLHFPAKNNLDLYLGTNDDETRERILSIFDQCLDLAVKTGIRTIVVHTGGNIDAMTWASIKDDYPAKLNQLHVIAERLAELLAACKKHRYSGMLAWENVPWPFDIPNVFSFTNIVKPDFSIVLDDLQRMKIKNVGQLGICIDLCHAWIISRVASYYKSQALLPPSIFPEERDDFYELGNMNVLIGALSDKIAHVHLADSRGDIVVDGDADSVIAQPTEGDELDTGDFSNSLAFQASLEAIAAGMPSRSKIMCTLEVKDKDFGNPEQAFRSLLYLGKKYY